MRFAFFSPARRVFALNLLLVSAVLLVAPATLRAQTQAEELKAFEASVREAGIIERALVSKSPNDLKKLLDQRLDPQKFLPGIGTPLLRAVVLKSIPAIESMVKRGGSLNAINRKSASQLLGKRLRYPMWRTLNGLSAWAGIFV